MNPETEEVYLLRKKNAGIKVELANAKAKINKLEGDYYTLIGHHNSTVCRHESEIDKRIARARILAEMILEVTK